MPQSDYCCEGWKIYKDNYKDVFYYDYDHNGWYIKWILLTQEGAYTNINTYAIPVNYCPICGELLKNP